MAPPLALRERAAAVDRLSDLPDGILLEVLSRLTFRQAVRTGVLSRRWKSLWHAVPYQPSCIDIDHRAFRCENGTPVPGDDYAAASKRRRHGVDESTEMRFAFLDFGDRVTTIGGDPPPPLGAFRLRVADRHGFKAAYSWIRRALTRRPMAVAIRCDASNPFFTERRPDFSFDQYCRGGGAFTGRLRALQLYRVTLEKEFAGVIANELPVLEDFRLEECYYSFARIASTSLQNLATYNCSACVHYVDVLALAAPRLATLRMHGNPPSVAAEGEMPSLVAASLEHPVGFVGLLDSLGHVTDLSLYGFGTSTLLGNGEKPGGFPTFHNLTNLVLDECDIGVECQALRRFLRNAPSLETLALRYCGFFGGSRRNKRKASSDDTRVPASYVCKNIKSVELEYHDDQDVSELDDALEEIAKKVVYPIESSVRHGRRTERISY
ncbi:unnamed protein product [Urochloa humidicola]